jgi:hypothetical protein
VPSLIDTATSDLIANAVRQVSQSPESFCSVYLAAMAAMKNAQVAVDAIVRTWFHMVQSFR